MIYLRVFKRYLIEQTFRAQNSLFEKIVILFTMSKQFVNIFVKCTFFPLFRGNYDFPQFLRVFSYSIILSVLERFSVLFLFQLLRFDVCRHKHKWHSMPLFAKLKLQSWFFLKSPYTYRSKLNNKENGQRDYWKERSIWVKYILFDTFLILVWNKL